MELFKKQVNVWKSLTFFAKSSILDVLQGSVEKCYEGFLEDCFFGRGVAK